MLEKWPVGTRVRRFKAKGWGRKMESIVSAEFIRKPTTWRAADPRDPVARSFGYSSIFTGETPPGFASEREAVAGWIAEAQDAIDRNRKHIDELEAEIKLAATHYLSLQALGEPRDA